MKRIWVDDERPMPASYKVHIKSVYEFIMLFTKEFYGGTLHYSWLIDLDHDAGQYANEGGDYIKILEYLEYVQKIYLNDKKEKMPFKFTFRIHSGNPVGKENMIRIIESNGWNYIAI